MELIIGANVIRTIGLDLTLKCVSVLTTSAQGIYNLITNIKSSHHTDDISKILKGRENLSLEAINKIENALDVHFLQMNE